MITPFSLGTFSVGDSLPFAGVVVGDRVIALTALFCVQRIYPAQLTDRVSQHVAFGYAGTMQIELIQPIAGENVVTEFLRQRGQGVQHLGIQVADLDHAASTLLEQGYALVESGVAGQALRFFRHAGSYRYLYRTALSRRR